MPPAARVGDPTKPDHTSKPLGPGPGSPDVMIGYQKAWRGVGAGAASSIQSAKATSDGKIQAAEAATLAAAGTPGAAHCSSESVSHFSSEKNDFPSVTINPASRVQGWSMRGK